MTLTSIEWKAVSAGYNGTTVIENIDFAVRRGQRVGLIGRNGAGKTTTLATAMGFTQLRGGSILIDGKSAASLSPSRRSNLGIGWVPQTRDVFRSLTVEENLLAGLKSQPATRLDRAYEFFPRLAERRRNLGSALSGGEQQMLSIARALMGDPGIILMDEPLEGLAPVVAAEVMQTIRRLADEQEVGIVLVEQHVGLVTEFCEDILVLERGQPTFHGATKDLLANPDILDRAIGLAR
ncbi:MAG: ABC transporter ATP-binding protein [Rhizobiaceae bacterium]|nr:ABC transporter ATP-binding protein [Rhizobiaceae bacterium]